MSLLNDDRFDQLVRDLRNTLAGSGLTQAGLEAVAVSLAQRGYRCSVSQGEIEQAAATMFYRATSKMRFDQDDALPVNIHQVWRANACEVFARVGLRTPVQPGLADPPPLNTARAAHRPTDVVERSVDGQG
ncbi:MAG TPA: hypothetical protein VGL46_13410 [Pseudonocardiaceae bacterium]|jgi:hypothetical protein